MRVVFAGITGIGKEEAARTVACLAASARGLRPDLSDKYTKRFIQVLSVEDEIKATYDDLRPFLDQVSNTERTHIWREAMQRVVQQASQSEHSILCFHNTYYRRSNFFTCTDWDLLATYRPTVFVTLINDVYDIWETVNARERVHRSLSYFHLPEILAWRSVEIAATEALAANIYCKASHHGIAPTDLEKILGVCPAAGSVFGKEIPHFVFSVKHPAKTLFQLLFHRYKMPVYASFPITKTRNLNEGRAEIDSYRETLFRSDFLTVIDPLTIDELRLEETPVKGKDSLRPRWPLTFGPPMVGEVPLTENPFQGYDALQYHSLRDSIGRHVEERDYRLVAQTYCLAAYRPFYGGPLGGGARPSDSPSGGVDKEIMHALQEKKHIYAVHPNEDRVGSLKVFSSMDFAVQPSDVAGLLSELEKSANLRSENLKKKGITETWEF